MTLSPEERRAFLDEPLIATLAVAREGERAPLAVPVWFWQEDNGDLLFFTEADSLKSRLVEAAGRFSLLVQRTEPTYRYVSAEGPVVSATPTTPDESYTDASRYLAPDKVDAYVERTGATGDPTAGLVTYRMRPEHWFSADLGSL
ncbi:pyridoxamine 5'-phosphate oxidase family protein [Streptomyces sp. NPDC088923]|uniref:pyridoxamine 5'-phosphate oxidase family protein n=1 Tax=Streptomyces sp. NPDC088923 TaxID=3365913 RepID=UPI0037F40BC7